LQAFSKIRKEIVTMRRNFMIGIAMAVAVFIAGVSVAADTDREKAAVNAAEKWVALVDAGEYTASWKEAAEYFRAAVSSGQWVQAIEAVRGPLGKVVSRKVKSRTYHTSLPGAPDGEYVVVQFDTSFRNKKSAIETVTPMRDKDGRWRVSGYFIK
jgi:hypothetical protein